MRWNYTLTKIVLSRMEQEIYEPDWLINEERNQKLLDEHEENERRVVEAYYQTLTDLQEMDATKNSWDLITTTCGLNFRSVVSDNIQHYILH